jgi:hypothetical protein
MFHRRFAHSFNPVEMSSPEHFHWVQFKRILDRGTVAG